MPTTLSTDPALFLSKTINAENLHIIGPLGERRKKTRSVAQILQISPSECKGSEFAVKLVDLLQQFNLSEIQARLYLCALQLGSAPASEIAEKAGIKRTQFYDIVSGLFEIGVLERVSEGKKQLYAAVSPEKLLRIYEQEAESYQENLTQLRAYLPKLEELHNTKRERAKVYHYHGLRGIERVLNEIADYRGEILSLSSPRFINLRGGRYVAKYLKRRLARNNFSRTIGIASDELREMRERDQAELRETKLIREGLLSAEVEIGVFGDNLYFLDLAEHSGFLIENPAVASCMKQLFELLWHKDALHVA